MTAREIKPALRVNGQAVLLHVKVVPNASRTKMSGMLGDRVKVAVAAPPEAGKANQALCDLFAQLLEVPRRQVRVAIGPSQPHKTVAIEGLDADAVATRLCEAGG